MLFSVLLSNCNAEDVINNLHRVQRREGKREEVHSPVVPDP